MNILRSGQKEKAICIYAKNAWKRSEMARNKNEPKGTEVAVPAWFLEGWAEIRECYGLLVKHRARISCKTLQDGRIVRWTERLQDGDN